MRTAAPPADVTGPSWARAVKRLIDIGAAAAGLLVLAPSMALIAIAIRASMGSPVLFRQPRPGLHGQPFQLVKFRSMTTAAGLGGSELPEHERVTRLGTLLRRYSAQIMGRHELPWDERLRVDVWYADHWSIRGDLHILLQTLGVMFSGDERAEGPEFWGARSSSRDDDPGDQT